MAEDPLIQRWKRPRFNVLMDNASLAIAPLTMATAFMLLKNESFRLKLIVEDIMKVQNANMLLGIFSLLTIPSYVDPVDQPPDSSNEDQRAVSSQRKIKEWPTLFKIQPDRDTGTIELAVDAKVCLNLGIALNEALLLDEKGKAFLRLYSRRELKHHNVTGGWSGGYSGVTGSFNPTAQASCVWVFAGQSPNSKSSLVNLYESCTIGAYVKSLSVEVSEAVMKRLPSDRGIELEEAHFFWGWNTNSHYTYHQDHIARGLTVTVLRWARPPCTSPALRLPCATFLAPHTSSMAWSSIVRDIRSGAPSRCPFFTSSLR